jgi:dUTP pyrophosphatase
VCKKKLSLANSVGVIDSGYRGEVKVVFRTGVGEYGILQPDTVYKAGERVAQLIILPLPYITLVEEKELPETERGMGGFGSSGL